MKTILKKKLLVLFSAVLMLFCSITGVGVLNHTAKAEPNVNNPILSVVSNNVSYSDSTYILYAISNVGFDRNDYEIKMLFWFEPQTEGYILGTQSYIKSNSGSSKVKGHDCLIFYSKGLAAKEMTDDIFARACVEIDNQVYYSEIIKFSVLEYISLMNEGGNLNGNQKKLFESMLDYGAAAQENFGYNTDKLANDTYYKINVKNGKCPDGFAYGRYKHGDKFKIKADKPPKGKKFWYWKDKHGNIVSRDEEFEVEIGDDDNEYEAVYKDITEILPQIEFATEIAYDSTISEVNLPSQISFDYYEETITANVVWDESTFVERQIGEQTIYANFEDEALYEEYGLEVDSIKMVITTLPYTFALNADTYTVTGYYGTSETTTVPTTYKSLPITTLAQKTFNENAYLKSIVIPSNITAIEQGAIYACNNLQSVTMPFLGESVSAQSAYLGWIFGATDYNTQDVSLPTLLNTITITNGVTIPAYAFYNCAQVVNFNLPAAITSIGDYAFYGCSALIEFTIPDSLVSLGEGVFNSSGLKRINVSATDKIFDLSSSPFGSGADLYCAGEKVKNIEVPDGIEILSNILSYCTSIENVSLPNTLTEINANAFEYCSNLQGITIPYGVTTIGNNAFSHCSNLTNVGIPTTVQTIGANAFEYCNTLMSIFIPDSVTSLGEGAFSHCNNLIGIMLGEGMNTISESTFAYCTSLRSMVIPENITEIQANAFSYCTSLKDIVIPKYVYSIGDCVFYACDSLANVMLFSRELMTIGKQVLELCPELTATYYIGSKEDFENITIGEPNEELKASAIYYSDEPPAANAENTAFDGLYWRYVDGEINIWDEEEFGKRYSVGLEYTYINDNTELAVSGIGLCIDKHIIIPSIYQGVPVTQIGDNAFKSYSGLTTITIPESITHIGASAFRDCTNLTEIIIPDSVTSIDSYAFYNCSGLTNVTIPDGYITNIADYAFYGCNKLTEIILPNSVTSIGASAFYNCSGLTEIIIHSNITNIGNYAFYGCIGFTEVIIPNSVTNIGCGAFQNCNNLTSITIPFVGESTTATNHKSIFGYIFGFTVIGGGSGPSNATCQYQEPANGVGAYNYYYYYIPASLKSVTITGGSLGRDVFRNCKDITHVVIGGGVTDISIYAFYQCNSLIDVTICEGITKISDFMFRECDNLETVTLPNSLTSIGAWAFYECYNLTNIVIPESVTTIGERAFYYCSKLTSIVIPGNVKTINDYMFYRCGSLTEVIIGKGVTTIGSSAFSGCDGLTSVVIPDSVATINSSAFSGCKNLNAIYYEGTASDWSKIYIGSYNSYLEDATCYYYSENEPALNPEGTAYNGNYWHYVDGVATPWVYTKEE